MNRTIRKKLGPIYWAAKRRLLASRLWRAWTGFTGGLWLARQRLQSTLQTDAAHARGTLIDLGCGAKPYRHLFTRVDRYIGLEMPGFKQADVIGDALQTPFVDRCADAVLCNQVLEHVPEPQRLMREAARLLKPEGILLLTTPQVWGLHHEPNDFFRYTRYGLDRLARNAGLHVQRVEPTCGFWATFAQRAADLILHTYGRAWPAPVRQTVAASLAPPLLLADTLDRLTGRRGDPLDHLLIARKPDDPNGQADRGEPHISDTRSTLDPGRAAHIKNISSVYRKTQDSSFTDVESSLQPSHGSTPGVTAVVEYHSPGASADPLNHEPVFIDSGTFTHPSAGHSRNRSFDRPPTQPHQTSFENEDQRDDHELAA